MAMTGRDTRPVDYRSLPVERSWFTQGPKGEIQSRTEIRRCPHTGLRIKVVHRYTPEISEATQEDMRVAAEKLRELYDA